jgi:hypothetical protein
MLTAKFAFFFHPVKESAFGYDLRHYGAAQCHIFKTFGIIIGVYTAQGFVEQVYKAFKLCGFFLKFYQPFVGAAFVAIKINRGSGIIADDGTGL